MMEYTQETFTKKQIQALFGLSRAQVFYLEQKEYIIKIKCYCYKYNIAFFAKSNIRKFKKDWLIQAKENYSKVHSEAMKQLWKQQDYRQSQSKAISFGQNKAESKLRMSTAQRKRYSIEDSHIILKEAMNRPEVVSKISKSNKKTKGKLKDSGYYQTEEWKQKAIESKRKAAITMKINGTYGKSKDAEYCINLLRQEAFTIEIEKEYPQAPNLHCDVYVKELDLWIEFHFGWYHSKKPFTGSTEDLKDLAWLKEKAKTSGKYANKIYQWTDLDVRKAKCAKDTSINYLIFYELDDFKKWYTINIQNKGHK